MKIKALVANSERCTNNADAKSLLKLLERTVSGLVPIGHLGQYNSEAYMEGSKPFVRFELNKVISDFYVICIGPEIRFGKVAMVVRLDQMLDGHGLQSQSWEPVAGIKEVVLDGQANESLSSLAQKAKATAVEMHAQLIERAGVVPADARKVAKKNW